MKLKKASKSGDGLSWDGLTQPWCGIVSDIAEACASAGVPFGLRPVLLCVRDMPYGRPQFGQTPAAALQEWRGTCSTKHLAVHLLLSQLQLHPRLMMARFVVRPTLPLRDPLLRAAVCERPVYDVHNFLYCRFDGRDTLIDITFPCSLAPYGFEVTADWYLGQDFRLACSPLEIREVAPEDAIDAKHAWLRELNPGTAGALREAVIRDLSGTMTRAGGAHTRADSIALTLGSI